MNNRNLKFFFQLLLAIVFLSFIIFGGSNQKDTANSKGQNILPTAELNSLGDPTISIGERRFRILIAGTPELQELGLGGRESLEKKEVMLFIFPLPGFYNIWMRDMKFPIDIIWLDKGHKVIFVKENALPESYPEIFSPNSKALYVLEANSGFFRENNLKIGSEIFFSEKWQKESYSST